mgnify:CR=1 FL=1
MILQALILSFLFINKLTLTRLNLHSKVLLFGSTFFIFKIYT